MVRIQKKQHFLTFIEHDMTSDTLRQKCYRILEGLKTKGCIILLDTLKPENRYKVSSECLKKNEIDLLEEYKTFLEIIAIDGAILNTKKLYNIHPNTLKSFFISLSCDNQQVLVQFQDRRCLLYFRILAIRELHGLYHTLLCASQIRK